MFKNILQIGKLITPGAYVTTSQLESRLTTTVANIRREIDLQTQDINGVRARVEAVADGTYDDLQELRAQVETMRHQVAALERAHSESKPVETPEPAKKPAARRARKAGGNA